MTSTVGSEIGSVSTYTFIDERQLLWHSLVFSAAERESAYVIDGLMRNDVVKSEIHSTDSLGISYALRLKSLDKQTLYVFRSRRDADRSSWTVTPDKYVNTELVEANWDDILALTGSEMSSMVSLTSQVVRYS